MSNLTSSQEPPFNFSSMRIRPLLANPPPNPIFVPLIYFQFITPDDPDTTHEIFVPPDQEARVLALYNAGDYATLKTFPPFSDRPPPPPMWANCLGIPQGDGTYKQYFIPDSEEKRTRVGELVVSKDYDAIEREFEPWNNQPPPHQEKHEEWRRGVERCAMARYEEAKKRREEERKQEQEQDGEPAPESDQWTRSRGRAVLRDVCRL